MTATDLRCARCGGPTTEGTAICTALRVASSPSNPTGMVTPATAPPGSVFCSTRCVNGNTARVLAQAQCKVCAKRWDREPGAPGGGRDVVYCSERCQGTHAKLLAKAAKDLAKDNLPPSGDVDKIDVCIVEAFALQEHWLRLGPRLVELPDPRAKQALRTRLERLTEMREGALAQQRGALEAEQRRASDDAWRRRKANQEAVDKAWRDQLG